MGKQTVALFFVLLAGISITTRAQQTLTDSLLRELQRPLPDTQRVNTLHRLSTSYLNSNPGEALRYGEEMLMLSDSVSYVQGQANAHLAIGTAHWKLSEYTTAIQILKQARRIAQGIDYQEGVFRALNTIGNCYEELGNYVLAVQYLKEALAMAQLIGSKENEGMVYNNLGAVYLHQNNYTLSLKNYLAGLRIFKKQQDLSKMSISYLNIGSVAGAQGEFDDALDYYENALRLFEELNHRQGVAMAYYGMGKIAMESGDYSTAEKKYAIALKKIDAYGDQSTKANILDDFGKIAHRQKRYSEASDYYNQSLSIQREIGAQLGIATSLKNIGALFRDLDEHQRAVTFAHGALAQAQQIGALFIAQEAAQVLYTSYRALAQYERALSYFETYEQYKDSLVNVQSTKEIQRIKFEQRLGEQEAENQLLKAQAASQAQQVVLQKRIRNFLIIGCILLCLAALLFLWARQQEKKANLLLNQKNAKIQSTAEDLTKAHAEIVLQRDALEEANRSKNKLFSIISHDLRSPLNSLQGLFALLQDGHLSVEELQALLPELSQRLGQTHSLLDNLLMWAKSQMEGIRAHPTTLNLNPLIYETQQLVASQADYKKISINIDIPSSLEVYADQDMVMIVLRNLLTNAVKFTGEQGTVRITGFRQQEFVHIKIDDTGVGISEEDQRLLFVEAQTSTTGTVGEKGTGLGLLLSKDFVEKNGGTISVESRMNVGSIFTFTIPANAEVFARESRAEASATTASNE